MQIGLRVKIARVRKGWTQDVLAEKSGLTKQTISHLEKHNQGTPLTIGKVCNALNINVESLVK